MLGICHCQSGGERKKREEGGERLSQSRLREMEMLDIYRREGGKEKRRKGTGKEEEEKPQPQGEGEGLKFAATTFIEKKRGAKWFALRTH